MDRPPQARSDLQIGLKWLLIAVLVLGATVGLLLRQFFQDGELFRFGLLLVTVVVPFLIAVGIIVRIGWNQQRRSLIALGGLLLIMPLLGYLGLILANHFQSQSPGGINALSNYELIHMQLPRGIERMPIWHELTRRIMSKSLSQSEVDEVINLLAENVARKPKQDWVRLPYQAREFLSAAHGELLISESAQFKLSDAYYGSEPEIEILMPLRKGPGKFDLSIEYGELGMMRDETVFQLAWTVDSVFLDDKPLKFQEMMNMGGSWFGMVSGDFPVGVHVLTVNLKCAYLDGSSWPRHSISEVDPSQWAKTARKTWEQAATKQLKVLSYKNAPFTLITDPKRDPVATKAIRINQASVESGPKGKTLVVELWRTNDPKVPLSFRVGARLGDAEVKLGEFTITGKFDRGDGTIRFHGDIKSLDNNVRSADIILTPTPEKLSSSSGFQEVWGKDLVFRDVPVERFDLEPDTVEPKE